MPGDDEPAGGAGPGWYPDYDAEPGWQRYWNGAEWTEGRRQWIGTGRRGPRVPVPDVGALTRLRIPFWALVAVAALVAMTFAVLVLGGDEPATSGGRDTAGTARGASAAGHRSVAVPPPPASTPGPPPSEARAASTARTRWDVASVVDGRTLALSNGARVRLLGVGGGCTPGAALSWLDQHASGASVTLVRDGADEDAAGDLLRFATLHGEDLGLAMIRAGVATAVGGHTRAPSYAAADAGCR